MEPAQAAAPVALTPINLFLFSESEGVRNDCADDEVEKQKMNDRK